MKVYLANAPDEVWDSMHAAAVFAETMEEARAFFEAYFSDTPPDRGYSITEHEIVHGAILRAWGYDAAGVQYKAPGSKNEDDEPPAGEGVAA